MKLILSWLQNSTLFITGWSSLLLVSSADTTLTLDRIVAAMKEVSDWRSVVGGSMYVNVPHLVQRIEDQYTTEREQSCAAGVWWANTHPSASWPQLAQGLYYAGEDRAMEKVSQYLPKGTHMESVQTGYTQCHKSGSILA